MSSAILRSKTHTTRGNVVSGNSHVRDLLALPRSDNALLVRNFTLNHCQSRDRFAIDLLTSDRSWGCSTGSAEHVRLTLKARTLRSLISCPSTPSATGVAPLQSPTAPNAVCGHER